jgi:hypothetical protein
MKNMVLNATGLQKLKQPRLELYPHFCAPLIEEEQEVRKRALLIHGLVLIRIVLPLKSTILIF